MTANWMDKLRQDDHGRRLLEQERLIIEVTEAIATLLQEQEVSRSELARRIGKTPAFVTKLLRGQNNFTLRTLSDVLFALDRSAHLSLGDVGDDVAACRTRAPKPLRLAGPNWGRSRGTWAGRGRPPIDSRDGEGAAA